MAGDIRVRAERVRNQAARAEEAARQGLPFQPADSRAADPGILSHLRLRQARPSPRLPQPLAIERHKPPPPVHAARRSQRHAGSLAGTSGEPGTCRLLRTATAAALAAVTPRALQAAAQYCPDDRGPPGTDDLPATATAGRACIRVSLRFRHNTKLSAISAP